MKIKNMKIYNTIQKSGTVMQFMDQNLEIKNDKQLKHKTIMNEILWIYGIFAAMCHASSCCTATSNVCSRVLVQ